MNGSFIQLRGPFAKNQDLIDYIKKNLDPSFKHIKKIGIQSQKGHLININGKTFEIGFTKILEFNNVQIKTLSFLQEESNTTLIDCIIE